MDGKKLKKKFFFGTKNFIPGKKWNGNGDFKQKSIKTYVLKNRKKNVFFSFNQN
jgi:hypothetical protein